MELQFGKTQKEKNAYIQSEKKAIVDYGGQVTSLT